MLTLAQRGRLAGLRRQLAVRGRPVTASTGESIRVLFEDLPERGEGDQPQAQNRLFVRISAIAGQVETPKQVTRFTEPDGRFHDVIGFEESVANVVSAVWIAESQRIGPPPIIASE